MVFVVEVGVVVVGVVVGVVGVDVCYNNCLVDLILCQINSS